MLRGKNYVDHLQRTDCCANDDEICIRITPQSVLRSLSMLSVEIYVDPLQWVKAAVQTNGIICTKTVHEKRTFRSHCS